MRWLLNLPQELEGGSGRVRRRIIRVKVELVLQIAEFAEPCRAPAERFIGSLLMQKWFLSSLDPSAPIALERSHFSEKSSKRNIPVVFCG